MLICNQIIGVRFVPPKPKNWVFQSLRVKKFVFICILITGSPITIPLLPKCFNRCMGGVCNASWLSDQWFAFWPPKQQKLSFSKHKNWKSYFSCVSLLHVIRIQLSFLQKLSIDVWEVDIMFICYQINGVRFVPPKPKNWVFQSLRVEKVIFICILITGSPITIPFLPKSFNSCMGGVCNASCLSDQQFTFWPPETQKLSFAKHKRWKSCFSCVSWLAVVRFEFHFF